CAGTDSWVSCCLAASSRRAARNRSTVVISEPFTSCVHATGRMTGNAVASRTKRQRSVFPRGPPLRRCAPAPAAASDANVGSVAASAAAITISTGQDRKCSPGPRCCAAQTASPANVSRSEARSPISLTTNPHGRLTPRARATTPSRLAPARRSARNSAASGHQPSATVTPAAPDATTPATVNTSGVPRLQRIQALPPLPRRGRGGGPGRYGRDGGNGTDPGKRVGVDRRECPGACRVAAAERGAGLAGGRNAQVRPVKRQDAVAGGAHVVSFRGRRPRAGTLYGSGHRPGRYRSQVLRLQLAWLQTDC